MAIDKISLEEQDAQNTEATASEDKEKTDAMSLETSQGGKKSMKLPKQNILIIAAVIVGGVTGVLLARNQIAGKQEAGVDSSLQAAPTSREQVKVDQTFGSADEETFRDSAEGILQEGGVDGEGSHNLVRVGGPSQTVYLTSSIVDLDLFVGHRVKIWGETFAAKKAGWLMDVGRVKVLELNAELPE